MELLSVNAHKTNGLIKMDEVSESESIITGSTDKPFIQANSDGCSFQEIKENHIIPVFIKDNEPLISHADFIETTLLVASEVYHGEIILKPSVRVSHPIKGRIPEAKNKVASELFEHEKTLYFERMAFIIELPSISDNIGGNELSLTIGGIKAYSLDNLYGKKGSDEHFKIFVGFQNKVCTNLCVWTDGFMNDLKVRSIGQLKGCIRFLLESYNAVYHLNSLRKLNEYSLTEQQFANLIGRCRMYHCLPHNLKNEIPPFLMGDTQIGAVCKDYYRDKSFCKDGNGDINLWKLYNLLTGVNKSSYIEHFMERTVNAFHFTEKLRYALESKTHSWYLN